MSKDSPTEEKVKEILATVGPDRLLEVWEEVSEPLPREKPQLRMQKAMREAARAIGLQ